MSLYLIVLKEKCCYKSIIEEYETNISKKDYDIILAKKIEHYEQLFSVYKKIHPDINEMQLCNNTSLNIEDEVCIQTFLNGKRLQFLYDLKGN